MESKMTSYGKWNLITGLDLATITGGKTDPITGKKAIFYGEARKEISKELLSDLHVRFRQIISDLNLKTVIEMHPSYDCFTKKAYLAVGYRVEDATFDDLDTLDEFLKA